MVSRKEPGLASATALITGARVVQTAVVFALAMGLTRGMSTSEYGLWGHAQFLCAVIPLVLSVPLGKAVIYFLPRVPDRRRFLRGVAAVLAVVSLLFGLLVAGIPGILEIFDADPLFAPHRVPIGVIVGLSFSYAVAEPVMLARGGRRALLRTLLGVSFLLLYGVGGALFLAEPPEALYWCIRIVAVAYAFQSAMGWWWLLRKLPQEPDTSERAVVGPREILAFVLPVAAATLIATFGNRFDLFIVPKLYPADLYPGLKAIYSQGAKEVPVVGAIAMTMLSLIAPELARHHANHETSDLLYLWRRTCRVVALVSIPMVGMIEVVAHELVPAAFGDLYLDSVPIFRWYVLLLGVRVFLPAVLLEYTGGVRLTPWIGGSLLVTTACLSVYFIPAYGLVGAAAAMVIGNYVTNWVIGGILVRRELDVGWSDLLDWSMVLRLTVAGGLAAVPAYLLVTAGFIDEPVDGLVGSLGMPRGGAFSHLTRATLGCLVYAITFVPLAWILRAVHADDVAAVRRILPWGGKSENAA